MATGISYADREREANGDYLTLARLPFRTLVLEWTGAKMPDDLHAEIVADAARIQARRGQEFQVSTSGQTVTLGDPETDVENERRVAFATYGRDIPYSIAVAAHNGTSHTPDRRGEQEVQGYANTLAHDFATLSKLATTDEKRATLAAEFGRYRRGYQSRYVAYLYARSRCMSTLVTGGSNFPVERNRKRNATADKRTDDVVEFREAALAAIRKALTPELQPISSDDVDAIGKLQRERDALVQSRDDEKIANAALRKASKAKIAKVGRALTQTEHLELIDALAAPPALKKALASYARAFPWLPQFANHTSANIRRIEERIAELVARDAAPVRETIVGDGFRIEENREANRVQIIFPGKPSEEIRSRLKGCGFKWAPSEGAWQRQLNHGAWYAAMQAMGVTEKQS